MSFFSLFSRVIGNVSPLSPAVVRERYNELFVHAEKVELAFSLFRDVIILTNLRYIEIDVQGASGTKIQYFSLPYAKITSFAVESAGLFGLDAELKIWALGVGPVNRAARAHGCAVHRSFSKGVDVYLVQRLLAYHVCGAQALEPLPDPPVDVPPPPES